MALIATASKSTHDKLYQMLGMCKPILAYIPPIKKIFLYILKNKIAMEELVENCQVTYLSTVKTSQK